MIETTTPEAWTEPANADLIAFLNARLDEEEAAARAAAEYDGKLWHVGNVRDDLAGGSYVAVFDEDEANVVADYATPGAADHIARHDPGRVLREVETKRRLLELAWDADQGDRILDEEIAREPKPGEVTTGGLILRAMAAIWSDHPDYRAEWKPGQFAVTIRIDRPDGQFVTSTTLVPDDLMDRPDPDLAQQMVTDKIAAGFVSAYRRAAELPE